MARKNLQKKLIQNPDQETYFSRVLALESHTSKHLDWKCILTFPITDVPLSLAHIDGMLNKTDKSVFTKYLEEKQDNTIIYKNLLCFNATILDGGLLRHSKLTYGVMASDLLIKVCSVSGKEIHLTFYKYMSPSSKDLERELRSSK